MFTYVQKNRFFRLRTTSDPCETMPFFLSSVWAVSKAMSGAGRASTRSDSAFPPTDERHLPAPAPAPAAAGPARAKSTGSGGGSRMKIRHAMRQYAEKITIALIDAVMRCGWRPRRNLLNGSCQQRNGTVATGFPCSRFPANRRSIPRRGGRPFRLRGACNRGRRWT